MGFSQADIDKLLVQIGRRCCICRELHSLQVHHIDPVSKGGSDHIDNAIALCPSCHDRVHAKYSPGTTTRVYTADELRGHRQATIDAALGRGVVQGRSVDGIQINFKSYSLGIYGEVEIAGRAVYQRGCTFVLAFTNSGSVEASVLAMRLKSIFNDGRAYRLKKRPHGKYGAPRVADQLFLDLTANGFGGRWLLGDSTFPGGADRILDGSSTDLFESPGVPPMQYHLKSGESNSIRGGVRCEGSGLFTISFEFLISSTGSTPASLSTSPVEILSGEEPI